jgi:hypothetical protein
MTINDIGDLSSYLNVERTRGGLIPASQKKAGKVTA